ncbi:putative protein phosphatase 2C 33 isoform X1 [Canna indica]|uniref:protein-serine/threonine phosphatase n=1 Tax=Canna indica TaxID=4628 RepID=A0AAQ3K5L4_9LILI|nr:putative protein phosphatase 2C 33 isoform X1 [Canna indica]
MGSCLSCAGQSGGSSSSPPTSPGGRHQKGSKRWQRDSSEEGLHRIPGRMFLNGSTSTASIFTQQGKKGVNQDAMIVWENFGCRNDTVFCGVFDGHGPNGHVVAKKVRDILPLKLRASWKVIDESRSVGFEEKNKNPKFATTLKDSFIKAFKIMDKELRLHPDIDSFYSGSTAVTLVKQGQDLIIGNIGDSRAVLATRDKNNSLVAVQLTMDLKPNLPREAERIRRCRGRVFSLHDEPDVARVWLPHGDFPGLAMSRAFGDFCLKDYGLISVPEISYRCITEKDEFIVLATDGVWDVLSNKEVVDIVASAPSRSSAARCLVESAVKSWRFIYPTSKTDDCAVVCLFLNTDSSNNSSTPKTQDVGPLCGTPIASYKTNLA